MSDAFGVKSKFTDSTSFIRASALSSVSMAGAFTKGVMDEIVTITNIGELEEFFGKPNVSNRVSFLMARQILIISQNLKLLRIATTGSLNATTDGSGLLVKNLTDYEGNYANGEASVGEWVAKTAGTWGNSLKVSLCSADSTAFAAWTYADQFRGVPSTSSYVSQRGGTLDELHIVVIDEDGEISGTPGTILEKFANVSQALDALDLDGQTNYYKNVINNQSRYIYWLDHPNALSDAGSDALNTAFTVSTSPIEGSLSGGVLNDTITISQYQDAYQKLIDSDLHRTDFLVAPPLPNDIDGETIANYLIAQSEIKQDFMLCLSPPIADTANVATNATKLTNTTTFAKSLTPSKFATLDSTSVRVLDGYNGNVFVYIPGSANLAGTFAYTNRFADVASSNAGSKRGQYYNVVDIAYEPNRAARFILQQNRINPVVCENGRGIYVKGDLTLLDRASAFDQTSVVTTFITLNRAITDFAGSFLFEKNDSLTDILFRTSVDRYLKDQVQRRIIGGGTVSKGNTSDPNEYVVNIQIVPINSIRFINLNFIADRNQGISVNITEGVL